MDPGQGRALGIKAEIGRVVADAMPDARRPCRRGGAARAGRSAASPGPKGRAAPPRARAPAPQSAAAAPARPAATGWFRSAPRLQPLEHPAIGPTAERRRSYPAAPRGNRASASPTGISMRRAALRRVWRAPAVERDIGQHRRDQPLALALGKRAPHASASPARNAARSIGWRCSSSTKTRRRWSVIRCG